MTQKITFQFPKVAQWHNTLEADRLAVSLRDEIERLVFLRYQGNPGLLFYRYWLMGFVLPAF